MLKVVKIGGNVVDNPEKLEAFLADFAALSAPKVLVHGGGKIATAVSRGLGIEAQMIGGRRVTDAETLRVVTMVYAGWINKMIVAKLQKLGCDALGLCGVDGGMIPSAKRAATPIDYGFVGDPLPEKFNASVALDQLSAGRTLVIAPITFDGEEGSLLNTNADTVAQTMAVGLAAHHTVELVYCFEKRGVLMDVEDDNSVIDQITPARFAELREAGVVADGMLPKLENAFAAIERGVEQVVICSADALTTPGYGGTTLSHE